MHIYFVKQLNKTIIIQGNRKVALQINQVTYELFDSRLEKI